MNNPRGIQPAWGPGGQALCSRVSYCAPLSVELSRKMVQRTNGIYVLTRHDGGHDMN